MNIRDAGRSRDQCLDRRTFTHENERHDCTDGRHGSGIDGKDDQPVDHGLRALEARARTVQIENE